MNERNSEFFKETETLIDPDEFILDDVDSYHYEVMEEGSHVWMGFYMSNGKIGHLNIFLNDGKIRTRYEEFDSANFQGCK